MEITKLFKKKPREPSVSENYIKIPLYSPDNGSKSPISEDSIDFDLVPVPPENSDTKKPLQLLKLNNKELIINKDLLMIKKEQNLKAAIKYEKVGDFRRAMDYYERASIISDRLGLSDESISYFRKYEKLEKLLEEQSGVQSEDSKIIKFLKMRILNIKESEFIKDMKEKVKELKDIAFKNTESTDENACEDIPKNIVCYTDEGVVKKRKIAKVFVPKNVSIPLMNKKKYQDIIEYRRKLDDL